MTFQEKLFSTSLKKVEYDNGVQIGSVFLNSYDIVDLVSYLGDDVHYIDLDKEELYHFKLRNTNVEVLYEDFILKSNYKG